MSDSTVFACDMSGLSGAERAAHLEVLHALFGAVTVIHAVPRGYRFELPSTDAQLERAARFIAMERRCCPFFDLAIVVRSGAPSLEVAVTGPDGVEPFIRAEFAPFLVGSAASAAGWP